MANPYVVSKKFNLRYVGKAYLFSLFVLVIFVIIFFKTEYRSDMIALSIGLGIFFPFAKYLYDSIIGFRLKQKTIKRFYYQGKSIFILNWLDNIAVVIIYFFSFFLGPIGILYIVVKYIYHKIPK